MTPKAFYICVQGETTRMNNQHNESNILELLAEPKSQQRGFIALMELYREPLYWYIRRLVVSHEDAQDVVQEAFIKIHQYINNFRGESSLKTWIYRIATNEAARIYRRKKLETKSYDDNSRMIEIFESDKSIDFSSLEAKLQRAILTLPTKQRVVFNLRYYDEMTYEQIAEVTESSITTLKTNYHYATNKIKEYILNQMED